VASANGQQAKADSHTFVVAATYMANEPLENPEQSWLAAEAGPTLATLGLDAEQDVFIVDVQHDPAAEPWRQDALQADCPMLLVLSVPTVEQSNTQQSVDGAIVVAAESVGEQDISLLRSLVPHLTSIIRLLYTVHSA
jgi:hypothetical protein